MPDPNSLFFELPKTGRPAPHFLHQYWYPGVQKTWEFATSRRIYDPIFGVKAIAIHATAGSSTFGAMSVMKGGNASWHWLVPDENEKAHEKFAWACAPESRAAWHIRNAVSHPLINDGLNKINHWSLGIEVVNNQRDSDTYSEWQMDMTAKLVRYAWAKYPNLQYVVSHAMMDPHRRTDPGTNFDWADFEQRVINPASRANMPESSLIIDGFDDVPHLDALEADERDSICGETHKFKAAALPESTFTPRPVPINWDVSVAMAEASQIAYATEDQAVHWAKENLDADTIQFIDEKDTELFIAENDTEMYIIFRGSMGIADWIANMKIRKTKTEYGNIHCGFLKAFSGVREDVFSAMTRARVHNKKIYLAGHSLGGALASIAAIDSHYHIGPTPVEAIYTYGMPKTCNRTCAKYITSVYGQKFFRFVNNRDIVTRIPPGSRHVGRLIQFDKKGKIKQKTESALLMKNDDITEEQFKLIQEGFKRQKHASLTPHGHAVAEGSITGADDHAIGGYVKILKNLRDSAAG